MSKSRVGGTAPHPAQLVVAAFATLIALGTVLLRLPVASDGPAIGWTDALFWSASASTVTGLGTVDVSTFSVFGELVLLGLIQVGGFGIMTIGSVIALLAVRRVGLRQRLWARAELGAVDLGELRTLLVSIAKLTVAVEAAVTAVLFVAFARADDVGLGAAFYRALFHGVSAFNNAGISLFSNSLAGFGDDPLVVVGVSAGFIAGGLGFPVLIQLRAGRHLRHWSLHTRITVAATTLLLVAGPVAVLASEWANPATLGGSSIGQKLLTAWFEGATPRTAGFTTIDLTQMHEPTLMVISVLMFVGAGSASTGGGIKVTTAAIVAAAVRAEVRGDEDVTMLRRRIPTPLVRQAMALTVLSLTAVTIVTIVVAAASTVDLTDALFEATSAFGTVGLSTGITDSLPEPTKLVLILMMFAGRVGPLSLVTAFAARQRSRSFRYAEERPIIG